MPTMTRRHRSAPPLTLSRRDCQDGASHVTRDVAERRRDRANGPVAFCCSCPWSRDRECTCTSNGRRATLKIRANCKRNGVNRNGRARAPSTRPPLIREIDGDSCWSYENSFNGFEKRNGMFVFVFKSFL